MIFWATVVAFFAAWGLMFVSGSVFAAVAFGFVGEIFTSSAGPRHPESSLFLGSSQMSMS